MTVLSPRRSCSSLPLTLRLGKPFGLAITIPSTCTSIPIAYTRWTWSSASSAKSWQRGPTKPRWRPAKDSTTRYLLRRFNRVAESENRSRHTSDSFPSCLHSAKCGRRSDGFGATHSRPPYCDAPFQVAGAWAWRHRGHLVFTQVASRRARHRPRADVGPECDSRRSVHVDDGPLRLSASVTRDKRPSVGWRYHEITRVGDCSVSQGSQ